MMIDLISARKLNHLTEVHYSDPVGNVLYYQEVMGDEQICQSQFILEFIEHVYYLCLDGYVKGGYRLVADDEARIQRESSRDTDSLSLSAGELVSVSCSVL